MIEQHFFELLQVAIGNRNGLTACPSDEEWALLYELAKKQALVGITFKGIEELPSEQRPPMLLFIKWSGMAIKLKDKNHLLNQECAEITEDLESVGFHSVVLKGQSNRVNYGDELCDYRTPGDIDLWTWADTGGIGRIVEYTKQHRLAHGIPVMPWHRILYYHVESRTSRGTEIEFHYRPTYLNCLWRNRRLQKWFVDERLRMKDEGLKLMDFPIPSNSFNAEYQLLHIYKHLFEEGIGLRQILDYYFVMKEFAKSNDPQEKKEEILKTLASFGMMKFVGAMMWVLQTVFSMDPEYMLCAPDEKEGRFLLDEIMKAGNFGKFDERIKHGGSQFQHAWEKTKHNLRLVTHYPEEVLWEPFFRVYHWWWRRLELWRWE